MCAGAKLVLGIPHLFAMMGRWAVPHVCRCKVVGHSAFPLLFVVMSSSV